MYKIIIILILLLLIILFTQNNEDFTGFRKWGFLTEIQNDPTLFPHIIHNKKINFCIPNKEMKKAIKIENNII